MDLSSTIDSLLTLAEDDAAVDTGLIQTIATSVQDGAEEELQVICGKIDGALLRITGQTMAARLWRVVLAGLAREVRNRIEGESAPVGRAELLVASARAKSHAPAVLRLLALSPRRFAELSKAVNLHDPQVDRVLSWAEVQGMVRRDPEGVYRLTALGRRVVDLLDSPPWLDAAALVARECTTARTLQREPHADIEIAGLTREETHRAVIRMAAATDPTANSNLAVALAYASTRAFVITPTIYPSDLSEEYLLKERVRLGEPAFIHGEGRYAPRLDALGEGYIYQALARAGITDPTAYTECNPAAEVARYSTAGQPVYLGYDRSIISLSSPLVNPITLALLIRFASPCYFDSSVKSYLRYEWRKGKEIKYEAHPLTETLDHAILMRFIEPETGISHFVLAGLKPSGTHAACQYFYANIERLLDEYSDTQFGIVLSVPRGYDVRKITPKVLHRFRIASAPPGASADKIDMRFLDVLAVLADAYPNLPFDVATELRDLATNAKTADNVEVWPLIDPAKKTQFTYERARALAIALHDDGSFGEGLVLLLARMAAKRIPPEDLSHANDEQWFIRYVLTKILNLASYSCAAVERVLDERKLTRKFIARCTERDAAHDGAEGDRNEADGEAQSST